jgi:hypothetical protein
MNITDVPLALDSGAGEHQISAFQEKNTVLLIVYRDLKKRFGELKIIYRHGKTSLLCRADHALAGHELLWYPLGLHLELLVDEARYGLQPLRLFSVSLDHVPW